MFVIEMGLVAQSLILLNANNKKHRPVCPTSTIIIHSMVRLMANGATYIIHVFSILARLRRLAVWFQHDLVANDRVKDERTLQGFFSGPK